VKVLLDTATFLWITTNSNKLSAVAKRIYLNNKNEMYLSAVSVWEVVVKYNLERLPLPQPPGVFIPKETNKHAVTTLPLSEKDVYKLETLPKIHNDPFDRMLVCQALAQNLTILTPDKVIKKYPVVTKW